ncbi:MAG: heme A synthase [Proteobacteria bacterium]|nr:MAG: heme A synthase [Pseudomonadota bacterium]
MRAVRLWLAAILVSLVLMIALGGITRLTGSGLSITQWKPIMGAVPPLHTSEWENAFSLYQEIPQFKLENSDMTLAQFKWIFFWEFIHRLLGRLIGILVLIPLVIFTVRKMIPAQLQKKIWLGFVLGGLQGLMGWIMVMSGLSERTSVSHIRLAMHFSLALIILAYFTQLFCEVSEQIEPSDQTLVPVTKHEQATTRIFAAVTGLFCLQIVYGALVAGLKAGKSFNTFPLMMGHLIPPNFWVADYGWMNPIDNPAAVQWIHRTVAWLLIIGAITLAVQARGISGKRYRSALKAFTHAVPLQFLIGVGTLMMRVPVSLGALHQFIAAVLVILVTRAHFYRRLSR